MSSTRNTTTLGFRSAARAEGSNQTSASIARATVTHLFMARLLRVPDFFDPCRDSAGASTRRDTDRLSYRRRPKVYGIADRDGRPGRGQLLPAGAADDGGR